MNEILLCVTEILEFNEFDNDSQQRLTNSHISITPDIEFIFVFVLKNFFQGFINRDNI